MLCLNTTSVKFLYTKMLAHLTNILEATAVKKEKVFKKQLKFTS